MRNVRVTSLGGLNELKNAGLKDEVEAWPGPVECGRAIMVPDDGSGEMEGVFFPDEGRGMVAWGFTEDDTPSDWIACGSLKELFRKYISQE